jgi:hypothetical protein
MRVVSHRVRDCLGLGSKAGTQGPRRLRKGRGGVLRTLRNSGASRIPALNRHMQAAKHI